MLALGVAIWALVYARRESVTGQKAFDLAEAQDERWTGQWSFGPVPGVGFVLRNDSPEAAYDVRLEVLGMHVDHPEDLRHKMIGPQSAVAVRVYWTYDAGGGQVATVTWRRTLDGDLQEPRQFPFARQ